MSIATTAGDGEITFGYDELFFSRTDAAGIIKYGNGVFQRIAGYSWPELLDKPHKLVRHTGMPRAVFWLLWDTIKRGEPIGAFVKNRAKNGDYYWVFAIVTPIERGYLSVRLRPSSGILAVVKREYVALADLELARDLGPADSATHLLERLQVLGFRDYREFMAAALNAEIASRDRHLRRPDNAAIRAFEQLNETAGALIVNANRIVDAYDANESVPFNFRVLAAQLGQEGAAVGVISSNYTALSNELRAVLTRFIQSAKSVAQAINQGAFLVGTAQVQRELLGFFEAEENACPLAREPEMRLLDEQQRTYSARAAASLHIITHQVSDFQQSCKDMNRLAAGLEVTRIMGKVECSRHTKLKDRLNELLNDLASFQQAIATALKEIHRINDRIRTETRKLVAETDAA